MLVHVSATQQTALREYYTQPIILIHRCPFIYRVKGRGNSVRRGIQKFLCATLRFQLSYSDSDNQFKKKASRALTLGSARTFLANMKRLLKPSETRD